MVSIDFNKEYVMTATTQVFSKPSFMCSQLGAVRPNLLKVLIAAGHYDGTDPHINPSQFLVRKFPREKRYNLYGFNSDVDGKTVSTTIAQDDHLGRIEHLLIVGCECPNLQKEFAIIAPGSALQDKTGTVWFPCLTYNKEQNMRLLTLITPPEGMWQPGFFFLGVGLKAT